ncbi:hypothetical protein [Vibrio vulnificus YJ016]|uniref:Uncharacterized protein n=1 Tax=Vibrio vulnificus (strain YJ016) TaxID=196600 RepID=Q7MJL6_VIBVY|nr:hypothetical protein [Vibrio vulnificus YJ016]
MQTPVGKARVGKTHHVQVAETNRHELANTNKKEASVIIKRL